MKAVCGWAVAAVVLSVGLFCAGCASREAQSSDQSKAQVRVEDNIVFGKAGSEALRLTLVRPATAKGPFPAVVFVFGGDFVSGARTQLTWAAMQTARRGYAAATVDYRLPHAGDAAPSAKILALQVSDVKCAVRWLRANAARYGINPDRIGLVGCSSGAYLAYMVGLTVPADGFEGEGGNGDYSSRVQAVVGYAGPTDFLADATSAGRERWTRFFGGSPESIRELYVAASPVTYVRKDAPPILTLHGDSDALVSLEQSRLLAAKLNEAGATHTLIVKKGGIHMEFADDPTVLSNDPAVTGFLDSVLKGGA